MPLPNGASAGMLAVAVFTLAAAVTGSTAGANVFVQNLGLGAEGSSIAPPLPSRAERRLVGEYGNQEGEFTIFQRGGLLFVQRLAGPPPRLIETAPGRYRLEGEGQSEEVRLAPRGILVGGRLLRKRDFGAEVTRRIQSQVRTDAARLRAAAMTARPPVEPKSAKPANLVSLAAVAPAVRLEIRYATTDNFMGIRLYERPAAYLQRPAAEALARVAAHLRPQGYGLIVYDAYRPWFVTKMFWDATPVANRIFVADPSKGSRHNRGSAVDLGLVDLRSGEIVEMPSRYDEFSRRARPDFSGGTDRQRWHRDLLRAAMEREGFTVFPEEWWHFDYRDWRDYPISNASFSQLAGS